MSEEVRKCIEYVFVGNRTTDMTSAVNALIDGEYPEEREKGVEVLKSIIKTIELDEGGSW